MKSMRWCALFVAALTLVGCGSNSGSHHGSDAQSSVPSNVPTNNDLNVYAPTLRVGQTLNLSGSQITVQKIVRPMVDPDKTHLTREPGTSWLGAYVRTCVPAKASASLSVGWWTFSAVTRTGANFPALQTRNATLLDTTWPLPQYSPYGQVLPNSCSEGWVLIPVLNSARLASLTYTTPDGRLSGRWLVPAVAAAAR